MNDEEKQVIWVSGNSSWSADDCSISNGHPGSESENSSGHRGDETCSHEVFLDSVAQDSSGWSDNNCIGESNNVYSSGELEHIDVDDHEEMSEISDDE